ncbi:MAG: hypothetical protein ACI4J6_10245 [Oscillospiraceae bacterium]
MAHFDDNDYVDIDKRPKVIQSNGAVISPDTEQFVYGGEEVDFDAFMYSSFEKYVNDECRHMNFWAGIMTAIGIVTLIICAASSIKSIIAAVALFKKTEAMSLALPLGSIGATLFFAVLFFAVAYFIKHLSDKYKRALEAAGNGMTRCYKYHFFYKLRYKDTSGDGVSYEYYADLGSFAVPLENSLRKIEKSKHIFGAVIEMDGKERFFLFKGGN